MAKKIINGKSYNTEYDSKLLADYYSIIDEWCRTHNYLYQKKSTGEYFTFWKDSWHPAEISIISEKQAKEIMDMVGSGCKYHYSALMESTKTLRRGYSMWGTKDDDPWDEEAAKKRREAAKKRKEEKAKKTEEVIASLKDDTTFAVNHYGVLEITGCSKGHKFNKYNGAAIDADKVGKIMYHKITMRIRNNDADTDKKNSGWYKYHKCIIMPEGSTKNDVKEKFMSILNDVKKTFGEFDAVMKDGCFLDPEKNTTMMKDFNKKIDNWNESVVF